MTRNRIFAGFGATLAALAAAGWLYAQETERPREPRPPEGRGEGQQRRGGDFRPPLGMGGGIAANSDFVFVLRGNTLFKYDIKTMKLEGKAELEAPPMAPPREGGAEGRRPPAQ
ncbi:MAG: hypothetical protein HZA91_05200 [Verrucomicrobia bacterium]|nr:hypothetical protein [Verrucomicrobiota bacterium]